ncbi:hydroxylamine reductase [Thiorhodovibrio frisius]|uniref:Hydroxylamine reductase n=1 Tax=Thiorhodovibrio frisius TaxID=631362 RepID=H8YYU8_9GAMM|nr:hydroxylamine reductase [Thiorhodovibrio frisius]EIC23624.1 hydroxylamine reductase [Thiorhodovibrio frisius]WPL23289.1 Hydroxylamine reductase [Thiorhodovibrio frisius]
MFCNQCEQTFRQSACVTSPGVCGKSEDVQSLQELLIFGLKGMAAYAHHARRLGQSDETVSAFIEEALFATMTNVNFDEDTLLHYCLECGEKNLRVMQLLDEGHIATFGAPRPTRVREGTLAGPGILITGHDLLDLWQLLEQLEGTDIKVYTHGEMLPAHMYSKFQAHPNLAGHYGGAWQDQKKEFADFPGPIVGTTNCVLIPPESYRERLFTTNAVAVPDGQHIKNGDFSAVIAAARTCPPCEQRLGVEQPVGYHRQVLLEQAGTILDAIKAGQISHFFVIGGCDGAEKGRNYFTDYAAATPADSFILTLGCGKYRIRDHAYGEHLGLPRLLDMGQCNDAYGAIMVAVALAEALECTVNDLPLTLVISWFEQKAVAVLLTLLHLGVKGINLGPQPPAFITPGVFARLQAAYDLRLPNGDPHADLKLALAA